MGHIFLSFLLFNIILIICYNNYIKGCYYIKKKRLLFLTILLITFATYGTGEGDYLHYKENVELFHSLYDVMYYKGMEVQYNYLAYILGGNYTLWRLVIFSLQFVGMSLLLYKARLNTYPVFLSIIAVCLVLYTYQRSYWGVIFYVMGLFLLLEKKNPLFLLVIILCYFSHTQNIVLLALLPLGFFNIKRWEIAIVVLFLGVFAAYFKEYFTAYLDSGGIEDADYINSKVGNYGEGGTNFFGGSIGEHVVFILRYAPVVFIVLSWLKTIYTGSIKFMSFEKPYRGIMNVTIGLVLSSLVILLSNIGAGIFFYRILSMTLFPIAIILPYMVNNKILKKKTFNNYIWVYIICSELSYIKDLYYAYAHGLY